MVIGKCFGEREFFDLRFTFVPVGMDGVTVASIEDLRQIAKIEKNFLKFI